MSLGRGRDCTFLLGRLDSDLSDGIHASVHRVVVHTDISLDHLL